MKRILLSFLQIGLLSFVCQSLSAQNFYVDGVYYEYLSETDKTVAVTFKGEKYYSYSDEYSGNVVIPASVTYSGTTYSVTSIGNHAFQGCTGLTSIEIPNSVTSIGDYAFRDCTGLTSIEIPNSVTSIGNYAFRDCTGLTSIEIPNSVTSIGWDAFYGCTGLTSIEIPTSVTSIGDNAFSGCTGLTSIVIPNSVTSIGNSAFYDCTGLTSIVIPNSVTSIGWDAFYRVKNVLYSGSATGSPWGALNVNGEVFEGFIYADAAHTQLTAYVGTGGDVIIPNSVTSIGDDAFRNCTGLTSIVIPNSVTRIGYYAFWHCKLRDIQVLAKTPASISESSFSLQCQYHATLFVPYGCFENYAYDDTNWYKFIHIKESASNTQNLSPKQAYALKSATTHSYIVYDAVNDAVGDIALDVNIDEDNANHNWQVIEQEGKTYIYNIGAKKYLYAEASVEAASVRISPSSFASNVSTQWKLSSTPIAVSLSSGESGINIENSGEWLFVLNPTLAVDENVSAIEQLETNGNAISDKAYTLQGTQTSVPVENGLYIRNGKKIILK